VRHCRRPRLDALPNGSVYWRLRTTVRKGPKEQLVVHSFIIETGSRHAAGRLHGEQLVAARSLFGHARGGRYFGGLWFKVFSERGPC